MPSALSLQKSTTYKDQVFLLPVPLQAIYSSNIPVSLMVPWPNLDECASRPIQFHPWVGTCLPRQPDLPVWIWVPPKGVRVSRGLSGLLCSTSRVSSLVVNFNGGGGFTCWCLDTNPSYIPTLSLEGGVAGQEGLNLPARNCYSS